MTDDCPEIPARRADWTVLDTPVGPLLLAATARGLLHVAFHARGAALRRALDRLTAHLGAAPVEAPHAPSLAAPREELTGYFAGRTRAFHLDLDWSLTEGFTQEALRRLATSVPYGSVTGYGELARGCGRPGGAQAVGMAMGANPLPVVVPCHRVVESDGGLGGFSGGLETKRSLLALEGVLPAPLF
ncbi:MULTISPECIES: methylated-DNA--[protein]-cysteine S-methyltransferase [Streptomyces]|uniref:Methylated-DNA--protein-cysteine methyltransferase n=4 Tax=Streptomyces TaxID=1883 RepID=A0A8H9LQX6_9ACTN|nr:MULTISPECIES: methylated-DNA--[protein]-cysteine S-methyltransferase [Streptomyces]NEE40569.1 methylated-DNA--[protein]-cysteine S-methyltransferase [Streptomyces sp. SID7982]NEE46166.1 methylated-DNA--[protein]-cysteine S-methyltransferase [Streptomyces sp. SID8455]MBL3807314.1 methylated-DNA--[protein]-cysteine S-methyltransferase [Streptomyces sp. BRB081]MDQ0296125.1 methylated-DNA-[protein]-cysteine S-methyltransferase [Streptomyces sp. DSM 41037]QNE80658.1 methylated-DNA--[protein]-cys